MKPGQEWRLTGNVVWYEAYEDAYGPHVKGSIDVGCANNDENKRIKRWFQVDGEQSKQFVLDLMNRYYSSLFTLYGEHHISVRDNTSKCIVKRYEVEDATTEQSTT